MKKYIFAIFFSTCFAFNILAQSVTVDEYKIYSIVIESIHKEGQKNVVIANKTAIIEENTDTEAAEEVEVSKEWNVVSKKILDSKVEKDFAVKNKSSISLQNRFSVKYRYWLVGKNRINKLLEIGKKDAERLKEEYRLKNPTQMQIFSCWIPFFREYPRAEGYFEFSRIGFSQKRNFAMLRVEGEGESWLSSTYYFFEKKNKRWKLYTSFGTHSVS